MTYCKFYKTEQAAKMARNTHNRSLTSKFYHKCFRVVINGPEGDYAVVDFKTAYEMQVSYSV